MGTSPSAHRSPRCILLGIVMTATFIHVGAAFAQHASNQRQFRAICPRSLTAGGLAMCPPSNDGDEASRPFANFANGMTNIFAPLNEGKKALVKALAGPYNREKIRSRLEKLIREEPVLMLSFTTCPFCLKAKSILNEKGVRYEVVELDQDAEGGSIRAEMAEMIGRTSVPAIWIGQKFVGGCNDGPMGGVVKLNASGALNKMLVEVGAL